MNKLVKGSVAGATGVALLMGGFGTYALWNDSVGVPGGEVNSGVLTIAAGTQTWSDASTDAADTLWAPATDVIVPGDVIELQQVLTINAEGKNLQGNLLLNTSDLQAAYGNSLTVAVTTDEPALVAVPQSNEFVFDADALTDPAVTATVTFTFDRATSGVVAQNAAADLADASFDLTQVRP